MMYIDMKVLMRKIMTIVEGFDRIEKKLDEDGPCEGVLER